MTWTSPWKATITFCAICAVGLWGCGGSGGDGGTEYHRTIPDGYSEVSFTADGTTGSGIRHSLAALLDASATGTGSGTGVGGPTSIFDGIAVTCVFTFGAATTVEGYTVTTNSTLCPNKNECIVCTNVDPNTDHCSLTCTGVVPSSAAAAADDFGVSAVFTSTFSTDMPDPYGTIRLDAVKTATAAFDLITAAAPDSTACDGTGTTLGMSNIAQGTWYANTALTYKAGLTIDSVNAGTSDCSITNTFNATATLTGAATPGTPITNNLGTVALESTICDYEEDGAAVAESASVCQPVSVGGGTITDNFSIDTIASLLWSPYIDGTGTAVITGGAAGELITTPETGGARTAAVMKTISPTGLVTAIVNIPTFSGIAAVNGGSGSVCGLMLFSSGQSLISKVVVGKDYTSGELRAYIYNDTGVPMASIFLAASGSGSGDLSGTLSLKIVQITTTTFTGFYSLNGGGDYAQIGGTIGGSTALGASSLVVLSGDNTNASQAVSCNFDDFSITNVTSP